MRLQLITLATVCLFLLIPLKAHALCDKTEFNNLFFERQALTHEMVDMVKLGRVFTPEEQNYFNGLETKIYLIDKQIETVNKQLDRECVGEQQTRDSKIKIYQEQLDQASSELDQLEKESQQIEKEKQELYKSRINSQTYCPANSYLVNEMCQCFDGYVARNEQCILAPTPNLEPVIKNKKPPASNLKSGELETLEERVKRLSQSSTEASISSSSDSPANNEVEEILEEIETPKNPLVRVINSVKSFFTNLFN